MARALMLALESLARDRGRTLLTLDTEADGHAERLYRLLGFVHCGTVPDYALSVDGARRVAASFFYKQL